MLYILVFLIIYYIFCEYLTRHLNNNEPIKPNRIYYACYKNYKTYGMFIRRCLGVHVCSSAIIINGNLYRLKKKCLYMQKEPFTMDYIKNKYYVLDTGYNVDILDKDWEKQLLNQTRFNKEKIFKGFNCLRNCSIVLNQLKDFRVKKYEIFTSIYVLRLVLKRIWKLKKN